MDDLTRRVERLEIECRRWRRATFGLGIVALVAAAGIAAAPRADFDLKLLKAEGIKTKGVFLVDDADRVIGSFATLPDGTVGLRVLRAGEQRLRLDVADNGEPTLFLGDPGGGFNVELRATLKGEAVATFNANATGNPIAQVGVNENGSAGLYLADFDDRARARVRISSAGEPSVVLLDASGNPLVDLPPGANARVPKRPVPR